MLKEDKFDQNQREWNELSNQILPLKTCISKLLFQERFLLKQTCLEKTSKKTLKKNQLQIYVKGRFSNSVEQGRDAIKKV